MKSAFAIAALLVSNLFARAQYNQFWGLPICVASPTDVRVVAAKRGAMELTSPMRNRLEYLGEFDSITNVRLVFDYAAPYDFGQRDSTVTARMPFSKTAPTARSLPFSKRMHANSQINMRFLVPAAIQEAWPKPRRKSGTAGRIFR